MYDYLIVGAGFSGLVCSRILAERGYRCKVIDKREHLGGNCYDYYDENGVLVHKYGPHYFRTNYKNVKDFISRFTEWHYVQYEVKAYVDGQLFDLPINRNTINKFYGTNFNNEECEIFVKSKSAKVDDPSNAEQQALSNMPREIYEKFIKGYTEKQWNIKVSELDASVTKRIPVRFNGDPRYFTSTFQAMPKHGYFKLFEAMADHENIDVELNLNFDQSLLECANHTIYTGPIDEFYNYKFGKLPYRSLRFEFEEYPYEFYQNYSQINYPNEYDFTRVVEIKHATGQVINRTTVVREYPADEGDPYYPIPNSTTDMIYQKYAKFALNDKNVSFIGRLANYKYLNMDEVIKNALEFCEKI